jgi:5-methylcytosine-specific restriction endonuclease McrA
VIKIEKTTEQFIKGAVAVHGEKFDYSLVRYKDVATKVTIICPIHGAWEQSPHNHLQGKGCGKCGGKHMDTKEFIRRAKIAHPDDNYDYSPTKYIDCKTKVIIICLVHGRFEQKPTYHLGGKRCGKCAGNLTDKEEFIRKAKIKYGEDKYSYELVEYVDCTTKVTIICLEHGEFQQVPDAHLKGYHGCKDCIYHGKIKIDRVCPTCNKVFRREFDSIYCSHGCRAVAGQRQPKKCIRAVCDNLFKTSQPKQKYCSVECMTTDYKEKHKNKCKQIMDQLKTLDPNKINDEILIQRLEQRLRRLKYDETNSAQRNARDHTRRARLKGNGGTHTEKEWLEVLELYGNKCVYCGDIGKMTKDHVIPIANGGTNDISNIVPACGTCNRKKGTKIWQPKVLVTA